MTATNRKNTPFDQLKGKEIVSQRGEFEKVYDLGRGRRQALIFAAPVHYKDADGAWQEIDNTLESVEEADGHSVLCNRGNAMRMEFDQHCGAVRIANGGHGLSWRLLNGAQVAPVITNGAELRRTRQARTGLMTPLKTPQDKRMNRGHKMNAQVEYSNARPGLSLRYSINGVRMKEDIILDNAEAAADAAIVLPSDYAYVVGEDMRVHVMDGEVERFTFEAPCTTDAAGYETLASVTLEETEDGVVLRYVLDEAFLAEAVYPVTIDPVVTTPTTNTAVKDAYIYEKYPTQNFGDVHLMRSGTLEGNYSISMLRFEKLIKLKASDTVISAYLRLCEQNKGNTTEYMGCFPIKQAWDDMEVTWNSVGASNLTNNAYISDDLLAYVTGTSGTHYFDLTPIYRDWYKAGADGKTLNYGVAIHCPAGVNDTSAYVEWAASKYDADTSPCMVVNYVSHAGRQDWWQYESMSAGRAGNAYVDLFNGNLVYEHGDGSTTGSRMPVGLTHVYNSCLSESNPVGCGMGWRTSMHQSVNKRSLSDENYYVWTDGGATEHFFLISGSEPYEDCEGMGLKLSISGSNLTITDKQHNVMTFPKPTNTTQKNLTKIADALSNSATLTYGTDGLLTAITDGVGRVTTFTYNASGLLSALAIPGCPALTFSYSGENLTGISYADVTSGSTTFTYESGSNLLTDAQNFDGMKLNIGYEAAGYYCPDAVDNYAQQVRRVLSLNRSKGSSVGGGMEIEYQHMTTKVTAITSSNASENKTLTYLFNSAGNPVCVYDELGYAQSNTYSDTVSNQLSSSSRLHKVVMNKLSNIDFSTGWTLSGSTAAQDTSTRCLSMPSMKFTKVSATEASHTLSVTISEAGTYTFSAYVKNDAALTSGELFIRIRSGSNSHKSRAVTAATASLHTDSAAEGWERIYVTANLPVGTAYVDLVDTASSGDAWFACPQLEAGGIPNHVNLLLNGDFTRTYTNSTTSQTFASDWSVSAGISSNALNGVVAHAAANLPTGLSGNALRIHSYCNTDKNSYCQSIAANGAKGDVFVIGGWVNANSVYSGDTHFKATIISRFKDTSGNWTDWQYNEFDTQRVGWKFAQWAIVAPKAYTEFRIGVQYARNHDTAMFSNVFIYREEFGESFTYDEDKNVVSAAALSTQKSAMEYDDADNLKSYRQPGAASTVKYTMTYGDAPKKHLLKTAKTPTGVKTSYEHDSYGNCTATTNRKTSTGEFIRTETTYTDGNYVATTKDARGNIVTQNVNPTDGTLTSVTDPKGQTVNYTYDASKRVTAVQTVDEGTLYRNAYTYENDRIKTVAHNTTTNTEDVTYTFEYDELGRKTSVKVGTQKLSTNAYKSTRSDLLTSVNYDNGGKVSYAYDAFDRLIGVKHDNDASDRYTYEYGANGQAAIVRDSNLGRVLQTECDLAERPMGTQLRDANGNLLYRTVLDYDKQNRLVGFGEAAGDATYKTEYTYDNDNHVTAQSFDGTAAVSYAYDDLGRVKSRTVGPLGSTYAYVSGDVTIKNDTSGKKGTSPLVASISQDSIPFTYTYDTRGNITAETRNGVTTSYDYDNLGQLVRMNDPVLNQTWLFNYDRGGNIVSRVRYAYTTGTPETVLETIPYLYGDANWKDKLTSYNGKPITYDAIGNPLTFDGWTYTWQVGRQLAGMSKTGTTLTFKYDHNGLRTQKVVQTNWLPETTNYFLHGKLITHMTVDYTDLNTNARQDVLHFFYDAQSRPAQVNFNGVIYTYVHNLQGDIVGLLDSTGALVVEYKYDAWGKPISTTGNLADTLGKRNPFRYRGYVYDEETGLYYLRSRYYNPVIGRFVSRDILIGAFGRLYQHNGFCYARNNPIIAADFEGFESCYILYDGRPDESAGGKGFPVQALWWEDKLTSAGYDVEKEGFSSVDEFVDDWNNMPEECDFLIIIAHGAEGTLDCNGQRLGISYEAGNEYPITHLDTALISKTVKKATGLLTCHGATPGYNKVSLANIISNKTQSYVYAAKNAKVNYIKGTGYPYLTNNGFLKTLKTIFWNGMWAWTKPDKKKR